MPDIQLPQGHQTVMPYLILDNAAGFLSFTEKVFDARERYKSMRGENSIMHAEIVIGNTTIMFADSTEEWNTQGAGLFIYVPDADDVYKKATDAGADTIMPLEDKDYGRTCGVKDPYGVTWWITAIK